MQQFVFRYSIKLAAFLIFMLTALLARAQDKIQIDKEEIGSWFERNWMWVAGGVVLILLFVLLSRGGSKSSSGIRKTTTVIKDDQGKTKSVTTTEEPV